MQVFCHMTTGSKGRQRGVCVRAFLNFTGCVSVSVCGCVCLFTFLVKCTIVQRSGDCVYLSLFSNAGGKERKREKTLNRYLRNLMERI